MSVNRNRVRNQGQGIKTLTLIGIWILVVSLVILGILWLIPYAGKNDRNPVMVFTGVDGNFPKLSMMNTLHAAGFEYVIKEDNSLPAADGNYVVVASGEDAYQIILEYKNDSRVIGFVLIDPVFPSNLAAEGLSSTDPKQDIAIFAGRDNAKTVADLKDARLLYERLSGDDTVYGTPIKRGGLFASKCFINNSQNRYLSLSFFNVNDADHFMFSPLFQNELAGYLSLTYQNYTFRYANFSRINFWFVLSVLMFFAALTGLFLYFTLLPVIMSDNKQEHVPSGEKWVCAAIGGISLAFAIGVVAMTFFENIRAYCYIILCVLPLVFMFLLFIARFKFITDRKTRFVKKNGRSVRPLFMSAVIGLLIMFMLLMYGDTDITLRLPKIIVFIVAMVCDGFVASGLLYADRKSRFIKEGGCSYFGNRIIFLEMLIPCAFALTYGLIFRNSIIAAAGMGGLFITLVPFIALVPLKRHTDHSLIPGLLHGFIYALILLILL